jgi:hypothetical protein
MLPIHDWLDGVLLGCFFFGLTFAAVALVSGLSASLHVHLHLHLPTRFLHIGGHHGPHGGGPSHGHGHGVSPFNSSSLLVFIAWFGGWAYLARNGLHWIVATSLVLGLIGGMIGGGIVFLWLAKVLVRTETALDPLDYRLPGTIARVTSSIRAGGVGEIVYEKGGVRCVSGARGLDGTAIGRGTEVVIRSYEHGLAGVEPWEHFLGDRHADLARRIDEAAATTLDEGTGSSLRSVTPHQPDDPGDAWANREPVILPPPAA